MSIVVTRAAKFIRVRTTRGEFLGIAITLTIGLILSLGSNPSDLVQSSARIFSLLALMVALVIGLRRSLVDKLVAKGMSAQILDDIPLHLLAIAIAAMFGIIAAATLQGISVRFWYVFVILGVGVFCFIWRSRSTPMRRERDTRSIHAQGSSSSSRIAEPLVPLLRCLERIDRAVNKAVALRDEQTIHNYAIDITREISLSVSSLVGKPITACIKVLSLDVPERFAADVVAKGDSTKVSFSRIAVWPPVAGEAFRFPLTESFPLEKLFRQPNTQYFCENRVSALSQHVPIVPSGPTAESLLVVPITTSSGTNVGFLWLSSHQPDSFDVNVTPLYAQRLGAQVAPLVARLIDLPASGRVDSDSAGNAPDFFGPAVGTKRRRSTG